MDDELRTLIDLHMLSLPDKDGNLRLDGYYTANELRIISEGLANGRFERIRAEQALEQFWRQYDEADASWWHGKPRRLGTFLSMASVMRHFDQELRRQLYEPNPLLEMLKTRQTHRLGKGKNQCQSID